MLIANSISTSFSLLTPSLLEYQKSFLDDSRHPEDIFYLLGICLFDYQRALNTTSLPNEIQTSFRKNLSLASCARRVGNIAYGGGEGTRTPDPMVANHVLCQLSYTPLGQLRKYHLRDLVGLGGFELPTSPLSGVRSNQLSYRPAGLFCRKIRATSILPVASIWFLQHRACNLIMQRSKSNLSKLDSRKTNHKNRDSVEVRDSLRRTEWAQRNRFPLERR